MGPPRAGAALPWGVAWSQAAGAALRPPGFQAHVGGRGAVPPSLVLLCCLSLKEALDLGFAGGSRNCCTYGLLENLLAVSAVEQKKYRQSYEQRARCLVPAAACGCSAERR